MPRGRPRKEISEQEMPVETLSPEAPVAQVETLPPDPPKSDVFAQQPEPVVEKPKERKPVVKSRITVETIGEQDQVKVAPGEPMVLIGLEKSEWKDIAIISSAGGQVKVPKGQYSEFDLDRDTNRRMRFLPPEVGGAARMQKKEFKPTVLKKEPK